MNNGSLCTFRYLYEKKNGTQSGKINARKKRTLYIYIYIWTVSSSRMNTLFIIYWHLELKRTSVSFIHFVHRLFGSVAHRERCTALKLGFFSSCSVCVCAPFFACSINSSVYRVQDLKSSFFGTFRPTICYCCHRHRCWCLLCTVAPIVYGIIKV